MGDQLGKQYKIRAILAGTIPVRERQRDREKTVVSCLHLQNKKKEKVKVIATKEKRGRIDIATNIQKEDC